MENSTLVTDFFQVVLNWSGSHVIEILIFLSLFIEVSKIKINPISAIVKFLFRPIRKEIENLGIKIQQDMDDMKQELKDEINLLRLDQEKEKEAIDQLIYANEMAEISRIRWEIIEFSNSLTNKITHVRDEYRHVIDDYKKYETLIKKYDLKNGIITEEYEKITDHYNLNKNSNSVYF